MLKSQYIVLGANMDHIGTNLLTVDGATVMQIYHGADDNASGTAVMLEVARRVAASAFLFKRSVIFVGFGAKEQGMAGSSGRSRMPTVSPSCWMSGWSAAPDR